jgi:hypothetical protein
MLSDGHKGVTSIHKPDFDQGRVDGQKAKLSNAAPSTYAIVGMDAYAMGYRAAFFERGQSLADKKPDPLTESIATNKGSHRQYGS